MGEARDVAALAKEASKELRNIDINTRNNALLNMSDALLGHIDYILGYNQIDIENARKNNTPEPLIDRLLLTTERVEGMAQALKDIAAQEDLIGQVVGGHTTSDGLKLEQIRVPMGVVAMIYEARPNVTSDAAGLALKTANACVLKGGSLAIKSNLAITELLSNAAEESGIPKNSIVSISSTDREATSELMQLTDLIDVLIPRGGEGLIRSVVENAQVPVIETGMGNCHIYVHKSADLAMAEKVVFNAKTQRPGVCNACESLVVDEEFLDKGLYQIVSKLVENDVEIFADEPSFAVLDGLTVYRATEEDFATEYHDLKLSIKTVQSPAEAINHINTYGTGHSDGIVTSDYAVAELFLSQVDSSSVYVNASTRFTDGGVFGLGAELGISTQKLHARGPMGAKALTTTKFIIRGNGHIRQ